MTINDVANYILKHRRGDAFRDWSQVDLIMHIAKAHDEGTLCVVEHNNHVVGVCLATKTNRTTLHVCNVITTHPSALRHLIEVFIQRFPHTTLTGNRRGKLMIYNTSRLCDKLLGRRHA